LTMVFVAHDLRLVRHISHRVAVMYLGKIVEISPCDELFAGPRHPYSKALLAAVPELDPSRRTRAVAARGELPNPLRLRRRRLVLAGSTEVDVPSARDRRWGGNIHHSSRRVVFPFQHKWSGRCQSLLVS